MIQINYYRQREFNIHAEPQRIIYHHMIISASLRLGMNECSQYLWIPRHRAYYQPVFCFRFLFLSNSPCGMGHRACFAVLVRVSLRLLIRNAILAE